MTCLDKWRIRDIRQLDEWHKSDVSYVAILIVNRMSELGLAYKTKVWIILHYFLAVITCSAKMIFNGRDSISHCSWQKVKITFNLFWLWDVEHQYGTWKPSDAMKSHFCCCLQRVCRANRAFDRSIHYSATL